MRARGVDTVTAVPATGTRIVRAPLRATTTAAYRDPVLAVRAGCPQVRALYLYEQLEPNGGWALCLGVQLGPGAVAAAVMPALEAALREQAPAALPAGPLRLLALSRRMLVTVSRAVDPL